MPDFTAQLTALRSLATEERYTVSPAEKVALRAVLAALDERDRPATNYKPLQLLCDDIAANLEAAELREREGRSNYIELHRAEQGAIELFKGIVRAMGKRVKE